MIAVWYIIFAAISTIVNISLQYISFMLYNGFLSLYVAMFIGTLSGLVVKYVLDKKYIFFYKTKTHVENTKKFILYSFLGIFTTVIFWGFEISFDYFFESNYAKYFGAIIGLTIGYITKYSLDKKFVFKD
jgi:putative flippase GtrA